MSAKTFYGRMAKRADQCMNFAYFDGLAKAFLAPLIVTRDIAKMILVYMPGTTGIMLRRAYYKLRFKSCGKRLTVLSGVEIEGCKYISVGDNVMIDRGCILSTGKELCGNVLFKNGVIPNNQLGIVNIGDNVHICQHCIIMGYGGIEIGDNCVLSACTKLYSMTSLHANPNDKAEVISVYPYEQGYFRLGKVAIGFNTWIGLNCIVMPGVNIGMNSFCISNSVVTGDLPSNSYVTGHPARDIGKRFQENPS